MTEQQKKFVDLSSLLALRQIGFIPNQSYLSWKSEAKKSVHHFLFHLSISKSLYYELKAWVCSGPLTAASTCHSLTTSHCEGHECKSSRHSLNVPVLVSVWEHYHYLITQRFRRKLPPLWVFCHFVITAVKLSVCCWQQPVTAAEILDSKGY